MKKFLMLLLSVSLIASSVGCGKTQTTSSDVTEITIWSADSHSKVEMDRLVSQFNSGEGAEKGIKIVYEVKENDLAQQVELALSTGAAPDIFPVSDIKKNAESGYIAAIKDLPGGEEFLKTYEGSLVESWHTNNGIAYTVPLSTTTMGLIYNKDMFREAGIVDENGEAKPPVTVAEMVEYAKRLTNVSEKKFGMILPMKWGSWFDCDVARVVMASIGHTGYKPQTGEWDYAGYKQMLEALMQMKNDGSIYPGPEGLDNDPARARFAEGNVGMKIGYSWDVGVFNTQFQAKCDWGVAPVPTYSEEEQYLQPYHPGWAPCINAKSLETKSAEKLMAVYEWYCGDEKAIELYKKGLNMPWKYEIVEGIEIDDETSLKGWKEFAELLDISTSVPVGRIKNMDGKKSLADMFMNSVWKGEMTVDEALKKATEDANEGMKIYQELNPDYDGSIRIIPDYNVAR